MANIESLVFDLLVRDRASEGIGKIGRTAEGAAKDTDALTQRLNELSRKSVEARVKLAGDKEAQAALDKMDSRLITLDRRVASPNLRIEGVARAIAEISAVDLELDKLGGKGGTAEAATSALGAGGLSGPGGMGALIGAGVVLSPVIATLGIGLAGFGAAAYGAIAPIEKAAGKTGGLAANMAKLNPEQRALAGSILGLGRQYDQFQKALQPEVLSVFNQGIGLAGHLLHDVQPVAQATGKALGGVLGQIDAEFQSGTWQQFFGFMARTAGPDMQLLGNLFVDLAADIPPLLTQLQPLATGFLKDADAVLKLVGATTQAVAWEHQHADAVSHSTGWLGKFGHAAQQAFEQMFPGVKAAGALQKGLDKAGSSSSTTSGKIQHLGDVAGTAAVKVQSLATQVAGLTDAESKALTPLLTYTNAVLTQRDDAKKLADALKGSHDRIGLQTDVQRASFSAAQTYIQDLLNTAGAADKSHRGIDAQIGSIRNALPMLRNVKGGTREYWQEVQTLADWLHRLQQIKLISEKVHISGDGTWAFVQGGGQNARLHAARGLYIGSGRAGVDDQLVLAQRDELIVPPHLVRAGAVDHLRGMIPGFAQGGIVGSYGGTLAGLQPWGQHNWQATVTAITTAVAKAMAQQAQASTGFGTKVPNVGSGVGRWAGLVRQALAMEHLNPFYILEVLYQMQTESGGNPNAINLTDCLTLDYVILTKRGWLRHDQVQAGDETIGYNPETGRSEWTAVTRVVRYEDAEVWRIGNRHWHADVTPNHRWWSDTLTRTQPAFETCPECGWIPRGRKMPARGVQVHRMKIHGVERARGPLNNLRGEFVRTEDLGGGHRLRLAAPADTDGIPGLSLDEARIIAWLQGDGTVAPVLAKPTTCPECGWLPGDGRKPHQNPLTQPGNSVAVHRAKKHGMSKDRTLGELAGYDGTIWQSKPPQIIKLRALLATVEHTETVRQRPGNTQPARAFRLRRAYVTDLLKRSRLMEDGPEAFVLALSPDQRAAWLDSMIDAEGHRQPVAAVSPRRGASGEFVRIAQVNGPLQDAIKLAVFLEGYRPTFSALSAERLGYQPSGHVGMARPHIAPSMFAPHEVLERQPAWCVTTELGTWTTRGGDDLPFLTGNSNAAAGDPSRGLLAHADHHVHVPALALARHLVQHLRPARQHRRRPELRRPQRPRVRHRPRPDRLRARLRHRLRRPAARAFPLLERDRAPGTADARTRRRRRHVHHHRPRPRPGRLQSAGHRPPARRLPRRARQERRPDLPGRRDTPVSTPLPVLPQIMVEAGLVTGSPVQVSTALRLDDPASGKLDTATLGTGTTWSALPAQTVLSFTITRPSTRLQGPLWNYQAGTCSILLDNSDGSYDPDNLAGPYVSGGVTQLAPMVPVRIRASFAGTAYGLYSGFADGWIPAQVTYEGGYAELTLPATDAFKVLAGITLPAVSIEGVGADTGARVRDILLRAGWYTSAERLTVSTGNSVLQGTTLGADALSLMQVAADSEIGQLYVSGAGAVVFRARRDMLTDSRSNTVQAVFGDLPGTVHAAGTELACAAVGRAFDDTTIANDVQATRAGGTLQEAQDAASIAQYLFPRTYARSDLILQNDSDALSWAQWVLYVSKGGEDRFETLQVDPQADAANLWPQVLGREIGDRIQVWHRPASVAAPITKDCFIAGITHVWDSAASSWMTTWTLQDASKYGSFLTLDNPTLGQLDANALTF